MGQKGNKHLQKDISEENSILSSSIFDFKYVIGRGGFGKVWKVQLKKTNEFYALKEMSKAKIIDKKSERSIRYERDLLSKINHPFIVNMHFAFQDKENLYLVMDLLSGGDLRYHISKKKIFTEEQTKFFICCVILGLEYLHINNVIHRDIKPENLVLDDKGYLRITDFGIAKVYQRDNSNETSGTPGYMSPEVIVGREHSSAVDYFALGVITYEFMMGKRPYNGKGRREIKEKIIEKQIQVKKEDIPDDWSNEAADFINKLLQRKPGNRLGLRGALEVKNHCWFQAFSWEDLYKKNIKAPFVPPEGDNFDSRYCSVDYKIEAETKMRYEMILKDPLYKNAFVNFTYLGKYEEKFNEQRNKNVKEDKESKECKEGILKEDFADPYMKLFKECSQKGKEKQTMDNYIINIENQNKNDQIQNKIKKHKQQTFSATNWSLLRQYRKRGKSYSNVNEMFKNNKSNDMIQNVNEYNESNF